MPGQSAKSTDKKANQSMYKKQATMYYLLTDQYIIKADQKQLNIIKKVSPCHLKTDELTKNKAVTCNLQSSKQIHFYIDNKNVCCLHFIVTTLDLSFIHQQSFEVLLNNFNKFSTILAQVRCQFHCFSQKCEQKWVQHAVENNHQSKNKVKNPVDIFLWIVTHHKNEKNPIWHTTHDENQHQYNYCLEHSQSSLLSPQPSLFDFL